MTFRFSLATLALTALVLMTGCRAATVFPYESCVYDSDCRTGSDTCITVIHNGATAHVCSSRCSTGTTCPTDRYGGVGTCVSFDSGFTFQCYQTCTAGSSLCDFGLQCASEGSANICLPGGGGHGGAPTYGTCSIDADCASSGDTCIDVIHNGSSTRMCSPRCVSGGAACPTDNHGAVGSCVSFDSGARFFCYQTCVPGSSTCPSGDSCVSETGGGFTTNICLPGSGPTTVPAYAGCAAGMTCQAGTSCIGVKDAHTLDLCTVAHCGSDSDCPQDSRGGRGACVSLDGDSFGTCVERCNVTSDCTYGNMGAERCTTHTAMGVTLPPPGVCLPT